VDDLAAKDEPVGTLRRQITNWGFAHYFKLEQGQSAPGIAEKHGGAEHVPCWDCIDAYGSVIGLGRDRLYTDAEIDAMEDSEVVYIPMDDDEWAKKFGMVPGDEIPCRCGQLRHEGPLAECKSYSPDDSYIGTTKTVPPGKGQAE